VILVLHGSLHPRIPVTGQGKVPGARGFGMSVLQRPSP
jgi:hypothetical protein